MESYFDDYEYDVNDFNEKYGTSFRLDAYATNQLRLENLANNFHSSKSAQDRANTLYKGTLLNLYKEYVEKAMLARIDGSEEESLLGDTVKSPSDFVNDFEALMDIYRKYCKENGRTSPAKHGAAKSIAALLHDMKAKVNEIGGGGSGQIDKTAYVKQQYLAGKMPLDKMVGEMDGLKHDLRPDSASVGRLITYMRAIDQVRRERSFFAKLNPFNWPKMYAESRDLVAINNFVAEFNDKYPEDYVYAVQRADAKASLDPILESLDGAIEDESVGLETENTIVENTRMELGAEKTRVYLPELSEKVPVMDASAKIEDRAVSSPTVEAKR